MQLMNRSALTFQVVMTKADKIKDHERDRVLEQVRGKTGKAPRRLSRADPDKLRKRRGHCHIARGDLQLRIAVCL